MLLSYFLSHHQCLKALNESKQVDVVFLDFAKAFDRVAHNILLQKIVQFWYLRCAFELM